MILYFDSFITDVPLNKNFVDPIRWIRDSCPAYGMPSKIDIAKYTLASYATYPWSQVLIKCKLADTSRQEEFEQYARSLFPNATIISRCSNNQTDYRESLAIINQWEDDWVWYAPNNDHPIMTHDIGVIDRMLARANHYRSSHRFISIPYSHFSEYINLPRQGSAFWNLFGQDTTIVDEDSEAIVCQRQHGDNTAVQIVNKVLLNHWFNGYELGDARIFRSEDVREYFYTKQQLIVISKREIAAHFDGYAHTMGGLAEIAPDQVPPLFIPQGFFEGTMRIRYGYRDYQPSYTNISPLAARYSFEDMHWGTDIKLALNRLPLFWQSRITSIDSNPTIDATAVERAVVDHDTMLANPYLVTYKRINSATLNYTLRIIMHRSLVPFQRKVRRLFHGLLRRLSRLLRLHPTSDSYISGDFFRSQAQHIYDMDSTVNPNKIKNREVVFVQSHRLNEFIEQTHPHIRVPYILITHNGDVNITDTYHSFIESDTLVHWFAQNCLINHKKITPIPIGLENKWYYLHGIPKYFDLLRRYVIKKDFKILYKFSVNTNPPERGAALAVLNEHPLAFSYTDWRQSYEYLSTLQQFAFVASPPGNGEDCIRTWEAMYLKIVPVLKRSVLTEHFADLGLPVILVDEWSDIKKMTPSYLRSVYNDIATKFDHPALRTDYWVTMIHKTRIP